MKAKPKPKTEQAKKPITSEVRRRVMASFRKGDADATAKLLAQLVEEGYDVPMPRPLYKGIVVEPS